MDATSRNPSVDAANTPSSSKETRRSRRKRDKTDTVDTADATQSSSSTPKPSTEHRSKEEKSSTKRNGRSRKSRENSVNGHSEGQPLTNGHTFEEGEDFIALGVDSDEEQGGGSRWKGKGRETNTADDHGEGRGGYSDRREEPSNGDRKDNGKDGAQDSKSRKRTPEREWDKGKRAERARDRGQGSSGGKRKYDMVFDADDYDTASRGQPPERKTPWVTDLDFDDCNNVAEVLHREVEAFTKWISPTPVEEEVRGLVVELITRTITNEFPDAEVLPFGSYATKLYLPLGDIDLVVVSTSMAYNNINNVLRSVANTLQRAGITNKVSILSKTRVPLVKFVTIHGMLKVDISFNQTSGLTGFRIMKGFLQDMRCNLALRSLVLITKTLLSHRNMNEVYTGGLGSYSIVCLAVSFLQMHPKIRRGEIDPDKNLGVLVIEFFELYGTYFNYGSVGISLRGGGSYYNKQQRGWFNYERPTLLSIEDPANPSNDVSSGSFGFAKVRATFAGTHGILTSASSVRAGIIRSRRAGDAFQFRRRHQPEEMSILSSIVAITQETINHRRVIQEVYDRRTLHNLLGIKPKPTVISGAGGETNERGEEASSSGVNNAYSAWEESGHTKEADMVLESDEERHTRDLEEDAEEGDRYDIGRYQPLKKRRKTGGREDAHTVFTTDDDEWEGSQDSLDEEEEGAYANKVESPKRKSDLPNDKRRSYWLSKGIGLDDSGD